MICKAASVLFQEGFFAFFAFLGGDFADLVTYDRTTKEMGMGRGDGVEQ